MRLRDARRVMVLLFPMLASLACAHGRPKEPLSRSAGTTLEVDNQTWTDMNVYVLEGGSVRTRLGTAGSVRKTTLKIPASMIGLGRELQFVADPVGSPRVSVSSKIWVSPGDQVQLLIPPE